jgi:hypothetical protein
MKSLDLLQLAGRRATRTPTSSCTTRCARRIPNDESGCLRWLEFNPDQRVGPRWSIPPTSWPSEKKFEEALALLDAEY